MGQKPTYKYNVISHKTVLRQKNAKKRPDRKEDLATPSRKRSLGQLGNLSRSVAQQTGAGLIHSSALSQNWHRAKTNWESQRLRALLARPKASKLQMVSDSMAIQVIRKNGIQLKWQIDAMFP